MAFTTQFYSGPPMLAHSLNSRGELGMFVNPSVCSCYTCVNYLADSDVSSLTALPTPLHESELAVAEILANFNRDALYQGTSSLIYAGFNYLPEDHVLSPELPLGLASSTNEAVNFWTDDSPSKITVKFTTDQMTTLKETLKEHTENLTQQQNALDHSDCRSHDEMAALDQEWDELDRKISEIDDILSVLEAANEV